MAYFHLVFLGRTPARSPPTQFMKRDRVTIIRDILRAVKDFKREEGIRKTNIMQSANLSSDQFKKYLTLMYINGLVKFDGDGYRLTEKGLAFLNMFEDMKLTLRMQMQIR